MKKKLWLIVAVMMLFSVFAVPATASAATVKLDKKSVSIEVKEKCTLKVKGTTQKVKWSSSNKKIATVTSKGVVKGIKKGKCKITAKVGKKKLVCKVTVKKPSVELNLNDYLVKIELTTDNFYDYFDFVKVENVVDEWGEPITDYDCYVMISKLYNQGLIYYERYFDPTHTFILQISNTTYGDTQIPFTGLIRVKKGEKPTVDRVKGSVPFVKRGFIKEYTFNDSTNSLKIVYASGGGVEYYLKPYLYPIIKNNPF